MHFNGAKTREGNQTVFDLFRRATVFVSEGISKSISLSQNRQVFTSERSRANVHLEECDGQLKVYVPSVRRDRELCYLQQLPKRLLHFLSISNISAEAVLVKVLGSSSIDIVDAILEDAGIIELDIPDTTQTVIASASTTRQDGTYPVAENKGNLPARQDSGQLSPRSPDPSLGVGSSCPVEPAQSQSVSDLASVFRGLHVDASDNSNAAHTANHGPKVTSSTSSVGVDEKAAPLYRRDNFLQACHDRGIIGTKPEEFQPHKEPDGGTTQLAHFQSITFQQAHQGFSFEGLRLYDNCSSFEPNHTVSTAAVPPEDQKYAELLDRVIASAGTAHFPARNEAPKAANAQSMFTSIFGTSSSDRDRKVGAAGELYVSVTLGAINFNQGHPGPGFEIIFNRS